MPTYRCIKCEEPADSLFIHYSPGVTKLQSCHRCKEYVDDYVEYDNLSVFLDILLQKRPAYRHVIFNSGLLLLWKFVLVVVMADGYVHWISWRSRDMEESSALSVDLLEWEFHKRLLVSFAANAVYLLSATAIGIIRQHRISKDRCVPSAPQSVFLTGMMISLYPVFLRLPAIIWMSQSQPQYIWWGCLLLQWIAGSQVYRILTRVRIWESLLTVGILQILLLGVQPSLVDLLFG
ncbi:protein ARV1-like [Paramacrobiotus metropolitanus]|uniref:protein ARV1-like n=1 Tax=Paramacrobiotus metropolitanus TaxID=2943436 RepID=UPI002446266C|nr:protein ARV1-like [Paramacrobiotus metropolitanus]XP_055356226.1 protein ARV1-like [Paramacrobiotus metropolitanus]